MTPYRLKASSIKIYTALLLLVVFSLAFYFYRYSQVRVPAAISNSQNDQNPDNSESQNNIITNNSALGALGIKINYPQNWHVKKRETGSMNNSQLVLEAPGTKDESGPYTYVSEGARITITKSTVSPYRNIEEYKSQDNITYRYSSDLKELTVNNEIALDFNLSYEPPAMHYSVFYKGGEQYVVSIEKDTYDKQEFRLVYDNLVKTIAWE